MDPMLTELQQRIEILERDQETRLSLMEARIEAIAQVVQSVANDTLRVCSALKEMEDAGTITPVPWELATALVDYHHEYLAHQLDATRPVDEMDQLKQRIHLLRHEYRGK